MKGLCACSSKGTARKTKALYTPLQRNQESDYAAMNWTFRVKAIHPSDLHCIMTGRSPWSPFVDRCGSVPSDVSTLFSEPGEYGSGESQDGNASVFCCDLVIPVRTTQLLRHVMEVLKVSLNLRMAFRKDSGS